MRDLDENIAVLLKTSLIIAQIILLGRIMYLNWYIYKYCVELL